jgi:hypothetical protein
MSVIAETHAVVLTGDCGVDEAESFVTLLESRPDLPVDLTRAVSLHTALIQAIMLFQPTIVGAPGSDFLARWVAPSLNPRAS